MEEPTEISWKLYFLKYGSLGLFFPTKFDIIKNKIKFTRLLPILYLSFILLRTFDRCIAFSVIFGDPNSDYTPEVQRDLHRSIELTIFFSIKDRVVRRIPTFFLDRSVGHPKHRINGELMHRVSFIDSLDARSKFIPSRILETHFFLEDRLYPPSFLHYFLFFVRLLLFVTWELLILVVSTAFLIILILVLS